jgi:hypothetical protein
MAYSYRGTGYLSDAVTTDTGRKVYLFRSGGYQGSTTELGYDNFGTRVLDDGATIESYACVSKNINTSPTANVGRQLFDAYDARVQAADGATEARTCTINELNEIL